MTRADEVTIHGVRLPKKRTVGDCELVLNGTALRKVWGFKVYVTGLYLTKPSRDANHIMSRDKAPKRLHMTMMRQLGSKEFESTVKKNIEKNFSPEEQKRYAKQLKAFLGCFDDELDLVKGSAINIDYLPGKGMQVTVDGREHELIAGESFYHAALRLWIGTPPQASIKTGLLGKER